MRERVTGLYGVKPTIDFVEIAQPVDRSGRRAKIDRRVIPSRGTAGFGETKPRASGHHQWDLTLTGGSASIWSLVRSTRTPSVARLAAPIGIATCLRPHT